MPSMMSTSTTSPSSLLASQCAAVAPTLPAPTTVTLFRLPISFLVLSPLMNYRSEPPAVAGVPIADCGLRIEEQRASHQPAIRNPNSAIHNPATRPLAAGGSDLLIKA